MKYSLALLCIAIDCIPLISHAASDFSIHNDKARDAVINNDLNQAKKAFNAGAHIDGPPSAYCSLLHRAVDYSSPRMVRFIVTRGANLDKQDSFGDTALHYLEKKFADQCIPFKPFSPHHTRNNLLEISRILIKAGANLTIKDEAGMTALDNAKESYSRLKGSDSSLIGILSTAFKKQEKRREQKDNAMPLGRKS